MNEVEITRRIDAIICVMEALPEDASPDFLAHLIAQIISAYNVQHLSDEIMYVAKLYTSKESNVLKLLNANTESMH